MKLFQQLLVAPAVLGFLAPLAANASEVNLDKVSDYAITTQEVATSSQFSDVVPGDWAYSALQNLSESYGCVDNAYTQTLNNGQALTRYEAAALINACLDGGLSASNQIVSPELNRLTSEFGSEMAILKGRIDGLETRVNDFQAGQFSSTTKLSGGAVFTLGAVDGSTAENTAMQYAWSVDMNTSFTGEDDLYVGFEAGNAAAPLEMDSATSGGNGVTLHSLFYSFPVGDFSVTAGPLLDQDDVVAATLSTYSDTFRLAGQPYSLAAAETGPGVGISYAGDSGFTGSIAVVADDGDTSSGSGVSGTGGGIFTDEGDDVVTATIGYDGDGFGGGIIYSSSDESTADSADGYESIGYGIYFQPEGFPSVNVSYDTKDPEGTGADSDFWMISSDAEFGPGTVSVAYAITDDGTNELSSYELYYNYPIADGLTIQPGIFIEEQATGDDYTGVVVETFFSF